VIRRSSCIISEIKGVNMELTSSSVKWRQEGRTEF
jgi:hypothetical protein